MIFSSLNLELKHLLINVLFIFWDFRENWFDFEKKRKEKKMHQWYETEDFVFKIKKIIKRKWDLLHG